MDNNIIPDTENKDPKFFSKQSRIFRRALNRIYVYTTDEHIKENIDKAFDDAKSNHAPRWRITGKRGFFDDLDHDALFTAIVVAIILVCLKILFN